jgi:hypothetical protein
MQPVAVGAVELELGVLLGPVGLARVIDGIDVVNAPSN